MKKKCVFLGMVLVMLLAAPLCVVRAEAPNDYKEVIDHLISTYGKLDDHANFHATGLIYGEFIDFDNNGTEEMLLIYKKANDNSANPPWATVLVYGMKGNKPVKMLEEGAYGHLGQTDVSYEILLKDVNGKKHLLLNAATTPMENGDSEKVIVFTMEKNQAVIKTYYGEVLPWGDTFEFNYTKCLIDNKPVSESEYTEALNQYYRDSNRLLLFPGKDFEKHYFCSEDKLNRFLAEAETFSQTETGSQNSFWKYFAILFGAKPIPAITITAACAVFFLLGL